MASSSNFTAIEAALVDLVESASGVGVVHAGARLTGDWLSFLQQFEHDGRVNGWTVSRKSFTERRLTNLQNERKTTFLVRGYYTLRDPDLGATSESEFNELIEAVCNVIRDTYTMTLTAEISSPAQGSIQDERLFGGVLVHYCELTVEVQETIDAGG